MQSSYQTYYFVQPWNYLLPEKNYPATVEDTDTMNMLGQIFKTKSSFFLKKLFFLTGKGWSHQIPGVCKFG